MVAKLNYDDFLAHVGTFGAYQLRNFILLCIPVILCAFHKLSSVFLLAKMDHRCALFANDTNFLLSADILNGSIPYDGNLGSFSKCQFYADNYFNANHSSAHEVIECVDYVWSYDKFQSSAIKTFKLICDRDHFKAMSDSLFMIGVFIGSFCFGHLSDKYGRRKVFVISLVCQLVFGFLTAIATDFITFTIFRMVNRQLA